MNHPATRSPFKREQRLAMLLIFGAIALAFSLVPGTTTPAVASTVHSAPFQVGPRMVNQIDTSCYYDVEQTGLPGNIMAVACVGVDAAQVDACNLTYEVYLRTRHGTR